MREILRQSLVVIALFVVSLVVSQSVNGEETKPLVMFPNPGTGWKAVRYEGPLESSSRHWQWAVYVNSESGDLLSFAARSVGSKEPRALLFWSDSAREVFPIGHPAWVSSAKQRTTSNTIRNGVIELKSPRHPSLEYTLVVEVADDRNRMVHGYALLLHGTAVFVQHTSVNPITSDLAQKTARLLVRDGARDAECH